MPTTVEAKHCPGCNEHKPQAEFHRCKMRGLRTYCKPCERARQAARPKKALTEHRRTTLQAQERERRRLRKLKVIAHYGGKCACCGENQPEFLTLDHINDDGAAHRRELKAAGLVRQTGPHFYKWVIRTGYPTNLQILCYNCNNAKARCGVCPHRQA